MPIDDVDFLKKNSETTHNILLIDSNMRNHANYPTPSMYTIDLQQPFYNVTGIEVLDASIPRTMYVIDNHNDKLVFYIGRNCMITNEDKIVRLNKYDPNVTRVVVTLDHIDCTMQELIDELNLKMNLYDIEVNAESPERLIKKSSLVFLSNKTPFVLDMWESTCNELLGLNVPSTAVNSTVSSTRYTPVHDQKFDTITTTECKFVTDYCTSRITKTQHYCANNMWLYGSVADSNPLYESVTLSRFALSLITLPQFYPIPFANNEIAVRLNLRKPNDNDFYQFERFIIPMRLRDVFIPSTSTMTFYIVRSTSTAPSKFNDAVLNSQTYDLSGNISLYTFSELAGFNYPNNNYVDIGDSYVYAVLSSSTLFYFEASSDYWLIMKNTYTSIPLIDVLLTNNVEYNLETLSKVNYVVNYRQGSYLLWRTLFMEVNTTNIVTAISSLDGLQLTNTSGESVVPNLTVAMLIQTKKSVYKMYSAGVVSIIGPRYALLRCPEIEEHTQNTYAYTATTQGMAMFKLGVYGYSAERYDFSTIKYKDFHPIARLYRMTFKFTLPCGELYDFKGIDHHMLLSVKTLVPTPKTFDTPSSLNPNYDPDIIKYLTRQRLDDLYPNQQHDDEDTDTETESDTESDEHENEAS